MISGNTVLSIKRKTGKYTKNTVGENVPEVTQYIDLYGFLDLSNVDTKYTVFNTKLQESDHLFICDYVELPLVEGRKPKTSELVASNNGDEYDIILIDNPMNLNKHLEIYLRYKGE